MGNLFTEQYFDTQTWGFSDPLTIVFCNPVLKQDIAWFDEGSQFSKIILDLRTGTIKLFKTINDTEVLEATLDIECGFNPSFETVTNFKEEEPSNELAVVKSPDSLLRKFISRIKILFGFKGF